MLLLVVCAPFSLLTIATLGCGLVQAILLDSNLVARDKLTPQYTKAKASCQDLAFAATIQIIIQIRCEATSYQTSARIANASYLARLSVFIINITSYTCYYRTNYKGVSRLTQKWAGRHVCTLFDRGLDKIAYQAYRLTTTSKVGLGIIGCNANQSVYGEGYITNFSINIYTYLGLITCLRTCQDRSMSLLTINVLSGDSVEQAIKVMLGYRSYYLTYLVSLGISRTMLSTISTTTVASYSSSMTISTNIL